MSTLELFEAGNESPATPADDDAAGFILRPYQRECLTAIREGWDAGKNRQLVALATGLGKTVIFSQLPRVLGVDRMLVLAHREELLDQAAGKLRASNPLMGVGIEQAERYASQEHDIVVASVPTLGRAGSMRIARWDPGTFGAVVVDEAHHALANSYGRILRHFGAGTEDGPLLLGVTATAERGDKQQLVDVFEHLTYEMGPLEGMRQGWLCPVKVARVRSRTDLAGVGTRLGDFAEGELADAVNVDERNSLIISAVDDRAMDREAILVFASDIAHVEVLTQQFMDRGYAADGITSKTKKEHRREILARYRAKEVRVLVNCGVFTEGYDHPEIDCIVMARPTKSRPLYQQMLGRGMRPAPGKENLLVLDVVDLCGRHKLESAASVFGVLEEDCEDVVAERDRILAEEDEARQAFESDEQARTLADLFGDEEEDPEKKKKRWDVIEGVVRRTIHLETEAEVRDLFAGVEALHKPAAQGWSKYPWIKFAPDAYGMCLRWANRGEKGRYIVLEKSRMGKGWGWIVQGDVTGFGLLDEHGDDPPWAKADRKIESWAGTWIGDGGVEVKRYRSLRRDARWRHKPAHDGQKQALAKRGVVVTPGMTADQASRALDVLAAHRWVREHFASRPWRGESWSMS